MVFQGIRLGTGKHLLPLRAVAKPWDTKISFHIKNINKNLVSIRIVNKNTVSRGSER